MVTRPRHGCRFQVSNCSHCTRWCTFCSMSLTVASKRWCETTRCACTCQFLTDFRNVRVVGIARGNALMAEFGPRTGAQNRHRPCPNPFLREEYFDMPCHGSVHRGSLPAGTSLTVPVKGAAARGGRPARLGRTATTAEPLHWFRSKCSPDALRDLGHPVSASSGPKRLRRTQES